MEGTIGEIRLMAGSYAPVNWAFCNGQILAVQSNTPLFAIIGTTYGGNGSTTFALPNLGGRTVIGRGQGVGLSDYDLGQISGTNGITLTSLELPSHTHVSSASISIPAYSDAGDLDTPAGNTLAAKPNMYSSAPGEDDMKPTAFGVTVGPIGSGQQITITQPTLGMNYMICLVGNFPPRS
ncbi:phage tail protein [Flavobacterium aquidurense]|jgi:microcystin-dependent protein|uniref:phage tail protein n=1 Tax=Flavobacterium aquidurense TaxID=362413 RepID=UPI000922D843|nr:tail fiber protein [Flavobacterium aquidurense]SHF97911.1 Microcystin-dependent protein [Flavobacterium frigidimaris]